MLSDPNNVFGRMKEFYGYIILGLCVVFCTAMLAPIGINVQSAWFIWTFPLAFFLAIGYSLTAMILVVMLNLRDLGRIGEMLVGAIAGTIVLAVAGKSGFGMTLDNFGGAIAGGIIGSCAVTILGTLSGRLKWYNVPLWLVRKPTISQELASRAHAAPPPPPKPPLQLVAPAPAHDPRDTRDFEMTFTEPTLLRFEHNGKVVYEQRCMGRIKLMLRDFAPYDGETVVFINNEPFGSWSGE